MLLLISCFIYGKSKSIPPFCIKANDNGFPWISCSVKLDCKYLLRKPSIQDPSNCYDGILKVTVISPTLYGSFHLD